MLLLLAFYAPQCVACCSFPRDPMEMPSLRVLFCFVRYLSVLRVSFLPIFGDFVCVAAVPWPRSHLACRGCRHWTHGIA